MWKKFTSRSSTPRGWESYAILCRKEKEIGAHLSDGLRFIFRRSWLTFVWRRSVYCKKGRYLWSLFRVSEKQSAPSAGPDSWWGSISEFSASKLERLWSGDGVLYIGKADDVGAAILYDRLNIPYLCIIRRDFSHTISVSNVTKSESCVANLQT